MCRVKHLKLNYVHFKTNSKTPQDRKTTSNAVRYRNNQEIKFLYRKKQNLNIQLYQIHLNCVNPCNNVWQHTQNSFEVKLNKNMDALYRKLNKKLNALIKQTHVTHTNMKNTNTQLRVIKRVPSCTVHYTHALQA